MSVSLKPAYAFKFLTQPTNLKHMNTKVLAKKIRQAEKEVIDIETAIMWHQRAAYHKGFTDYSGLMSRQQLTDAKERRLTLKKFIADARKLARNESK